jgi:hypothetical protein
MNCWFGGGERCASSSLELDLSIKLSWERRETCGLMVLVESCERESMESDERKSDNNNDCWELRRRIPGHVEESKIMLLSRGGQQYTRVTSTLYVCAAMNGT